MIKHCFFQVFIKTKNTTIMKIITESERVMGFRYRKPDVNSVIRFNAPDSGDIKPKLKDLLRDMNVEYNSVDGGGGRYNSYALDLNLYDEKEAQAIINDLNVKLMLDGIRIDDATYSIKNTEIAEGDKVTSSIRVLVRRVLLEMFIPV